MRRTLLALALLALPAQAQPQAPSGAPPQLDEARRADGARLVPERFLRRWDPLTIFFEADTGPAQGGPEDAPERFVQLSPPQPGAWQWLGPRALQFRPADPWTPLARVQVGLGGQVRTLVPLLPAPIGTTPAAAQAWEDGAPLGDTIILTFADAVDPAALARLLSLELRPAPGLEGGPAEVLTARDFTIKPLERADAAAPARYLVTLRAPVADGKVALLRLRLSDAPGLDDESFTLRLRSASPFSLTDATCGPGFSRERRDGVLRCEAYDGPTRRSLTLRFSEAPQAVDAARLREILRITPPVEDLAIAPEGRSWRVTGRFEAERGYALRLEGAGLRDTRGRALAAPGEGLRFAFAAEKPALRWDTGRGLAERLGPQMLPLRGQGYERADLRIHAIDPQGRDFWPFPAAGLETPDDAPPPLSGNEPQPWAGAEALSRRAMAQRIAALGSPSVSELVSLPVRRGGPEARFGLDIAPFLARIAGPGQPGSYLVGLRPIDGGNRRWMRLDVTDLALTTVEEAERVRFAVTSLASARPVEGAEIRLEGSRGDAFTLLARGVTGPDGSFTWAAPAGRPERLRRVLRRITIIKGNDVLVLDPASGPRQYAGGRWSRPEEPWLGWTQSDAAERREAPRTLCHLFTERPIYRPEDPVHIQAFVRTWQGGALSLSRAKGTLVVTAPDDQEWRIAATPDEAGGFHHLFAEKTEASGEYRARFEYAEGQSCGEITFKKEAYRLPSFEVLLEAPARAPLDAPFAVNLLARYFAGGLAAGRPVAWRVAQFPESWAPPAREGFRFSSDSRWSGLGDFRASPVMNQQVRTDESGANRLDLDPSAEPTAQPRRYRIEATVTGDDDIQVRATQSVLALPPFVLGLKLPRYIAALGAIEGEALAVDAQGQPQAGLAMTARLIRRQWNSVLQASDFSQGAARYVTEMVDETVEERRLTSADAALPLRFEAKEAGVYLVELAAEDKVGRRQSVKIDLFVAGDGAVTWPQPPAQTFTVSPERESYAPGEAATLLIQSPFQTARALVVTEEPEGRFGYDWVEIANGFGRYTLTVRKEQMPRLAVHVLLMRGRLPASAPTATAPFDQGKPVTLAASTSLKVSPVEHQVAVSLEAPATARPGEEIEVVLKLADRQGRPLSGEAAFWLVDQAVLSLAREAPLDPLASFVLDRPDRMVATDTRNMALGIIPLEENPGGDGSTDDWGQENISVRRNFTPVPIYLPRVMVGPDGTARIRLRLPDTLTVFKLRAKAVSGASRFGFGTGELRVRQPVVAQAALPRFLRPGDSFEAALIGRIIEGPGGTGRARIEAQGARLAGPAEQAFAWQQNRPARLAFPLAVPEASPEAAARLRLFVRRDADGVGDAVELSLPLRPDRAPITERAFIDIPAQGSAALPASAAAIRPGSFAGRLTVAADPAIPRFVAGLNLLRAAPHPGPEQRLALVWAELALAALLPESIEARLEADLRAAIEAVRQATDENGLVAFRPRQKGSVWLTAQALRVLNEAAARQLAVDPALIERLSTVLGRALRSDSPVLLAGEELRERVAALLALAEAGKLEPAYTAELARRAALMPTETLAQAASALARLPMAEQAMLPGLMQALWGRVRLEQRQGALAYAGLAETGGNPLILPSEARGLAETMQAAARATPAEPRLALLRAGLLRLAGPEGWGNPNADAAALRALAANWAASGAEAAVSASLPGGEQRAALSAAQPFASWALAGPGAGSLRNAGPAPALALAERRYTPAGPGAEAPAVEAGFVLTRTLFRVPPGGGPLERLAPGSDGAIHLAAGDVVEEQAELVSPEARVHVALSLPIAAGFEPLNPALATAPAEAAPSAAPSPEPGWSAYGDDAVTAVYQSLPAGTHRLAFRLRAQVPGRYTQPPGTAAMLYRPEVQGLSAGARIVVGP